MLSRQQPVLRLFVGLGNPGTEYIQTRHNTGADYIRYLSQRLNVTLTPNKKLKASIGITKVTMPYLRTEEEWILALPDSFLNVSGAPVKNLLQTFSVENENLVVCHDCLDHGISRVALRFGGSARGHNGLKSIDEHIKTLDFWRIRFGIGRPEGKSSFSVSRYVLSKWSQDELKLMGRVYADVTQKMIQGDSKFSFGMTL